MKIEPWALQTKITCMCEANIDRHDGQCVCVCVCARARVCACVCANERERERGREGGRERCKG